MRGESSAIGKLVLRGTRIVLPKQLRCQALKLAHEGYSGILAMKQRLSTKVWWPGIDKGTGQNNYTRAGPTFRVGGGVLKDTTYLRTLPTTFYWLLNLS